MNVYLGHRHMIDVCLHCFGTSGEPLAVLTAQVLRIFDGSVAAYRCTSRGVDGHLVVGRLDNYHRWSEPVALFVARALKAVSEADSEVATVVESFRYLVDINFEGRRLSRTPFSVLEGMLTMSESRKSLKPVAAEYSIWDVAADALCIDATGKDELPDLPEPLVVKVHEYDGVKYCKSADLPAEAQAAFRHSRFGSTVPYIPGEPDAYYAGDMYRFLGAS